MAGYRQIHTKIWKDEWFIELSTEERLLFIYLFSNDEASITGFYKLPIRVMMNETGMERETIEAALSRFEQDRKVFYQDGVVWVVHMDRYHANASVTTQKRMAADIARIPDCELKRMYLQYHDTPSIPYGYPMSGASETSVKAKAESEAKAKDEAKAEEEAEDGDGGFSADPLVGAWERSTGLLVGNPEQAVKALEEMHALGVEPEDIETAVTELTEKGKNNWRGLASIVQPAIIALNKRKAKSAPGSVNGGGKPRETGRNGAIERALKRLEQEAEGGK